MPFITTTHSGGGGGGCNVCNGVGTVLDIKTGDTFRCRKCNKKSINYYKPNKERTKVERGKLTKSLRFAVLEKYNFKCRACGYGASDGKKLHVDHVIPISKGGKTVMKNLQALCNDCNIGKGTKIVDGWAVQLEEIKASMADVHTSGGGEFDN